VIENKVVAITGASGGIGRAAALHLAGRGARVVLGARRASALDEVVQQVHQAGGEAVAVEMDVRDREDVARLVRAAVSRYGRLDVLVNNAGIGPVSPLDQLKVDEWDAMVDVNVKGVLNGIAAALPLFREQRRGHMITVGSTAALQATPTMAVYAGTKAAVRAICDGLRVESGPDLRVTLVMPGFVATDFVATVTDERTRSQLEQRRDALAIPPSAIAEAIAFAIDQPEQVDINEITVRPTAQ
jgi:NADP-dependent 3-hydroxy acid dehydrogenase YdfG